MERFRLALPILAQVHVGNLSYFSRLTDAATFTDLAEVETRRRHLVQAQEVCAVMDGADWLQAFVDIHRGDAVRILDFPHAAEHLSIVLEALSTGGRVFPARMLDRCLHILKHRGPEALARLADRLTEGEINREEVREHLALFAQTARFDALSALSTSGLADRFRDGGER